MSEGKRWLAKFGRGAAICLTTVASMGAWNVQSPPNGEQIGKTSTVGGYGDAGAQSAPFAFQVRKRLQFGEVGSIINQATGESSDTSGWSKDVTPPSNPGEWPLGYALACIHAEGAVQNSKTIEFN